MRLMTWRRMISSKVGPMVSLAARGVLLLYLITSLTGQIVHDNCPVLVIKLHGCHSTRVVFDIKNIE